MATTTLVSAEHGYKPSVNFFAHFIAWCDKQEKVKIMWTGVSLALHACIFTPFAMMAVLLSGTPMLLLVLTVATIFINLVVNLAAMPTRIIIPAFILSILADISVIAAAVYMGLDFARVF